MALVLEREIPPHRRRRAKRCKCAFKIERRYVGCDLPTFMSWLFKREWHLCGAYETDRARANAFRSFTTRGELHGIRWEYRLAA